MGTTPPTEGSQGKAWAGAWWRGGSSGTQLTPWRLSVSCWTDPTWSHPWHLLQDPVIFLCCVNQFALSFLSPII